MPLDQVKPGMKGIGKTVFRGSEVEEFEAEVLGVLKNIAPRQDAILARLSGGPPGEDRSDGRHERQPGLRWRPADRGRVLLLPLLKRGGGGRHAYRANGRQLRAVERAGAGRPHCGRGFLDRSSPDARDSSARDPGCPRFRERARFCRLRIDDRRRGFPEAPGRPVVPIHRHAAGSVGSGGRSGRRSGRRAGALRNEGAAGRGAGFRRDRGRVG